MTKTLGTYDAKARFSEMLHMVEEGNTVIITRNGKRIAKVVPFTATTKRKRGSMKKYFGKMADDFNEPLADFADYQ